MKYVYKILTLILMSIFTATNAEAQIKDGDYIVTQGNTVTVSIGASYASTLRRATSVSATWTAESGAISIQSRTNTTCTILGNEPGETRLNYHCSYMIDGHSRTMNFYYDVTVESNVIYVSNVTMSESSATLDIGDRLQLSATTYPVNATDHSIRWTTENYNIASVSDNGLVTARDTGKVRIWASATDGGGACDYCDITVKAPVKPDLIELSEYSHDLEIGEMFTLYATIIPDNADNKAVIWESDNPDVATVSDGIVTAISEGVCCITCTSSDYSYVSATCIVTVSKPREYWLSLALLNGTFAINVTGMDPVHVKVTPDEGYEIHSLTLDGIEQTIEKTGTELTLPKFTCDLTLNAVFEKDASHSGLDAAGAEDSDLHVSLYRDTVRVTGMQPGDTINVYDQNGRLVKATTAESFSLRDHGVYILCVGSKTFKFAM